MEHIEALKADTPTTAVVALLTDPAFADAVPCTHGEVMTGVPGWVREQGVQILADRCDDDWLLGKGTAWTLEIDRGEVISLRHRAPVPLARCPTIALATEARRTSQHVGGVNTR